MDKTTKNKEFVVIYSKTRTINGKREYASQYGLKAFKFYIPIEKYRKR